MWKRIPAPGMTPPLVSVSSTASPCKTACHVAFVCRPRQGPVFCSDCHLQRPHLLMQEPAFSNNFSGKPVRPHQRAGGCLLEPVRDIKAWRLIGCAVTKTSGNAFAIGLQGKRRVIRCLMYHISRDQRRLNGRPDTLRSEEHTSEL